MRELDLPVEVDFLEASSYGNATESSREVRILKDLSGGEIAGRDVLVVEDIIDTGRTLKHVLAILKTRRPGGSRSARSSTSRRGAEVDVKARWVGLRIPDEFVVGYGIDYAQRNRNLPHIGKVRFTLRGLWAEAECTSHAQSHAQPMHLARVRGQSSTLRAHGRRITRMAALRATGDALGGMADRTLAFGPFLLDPARGALLRDGAPVAVGQRPRGARGARGGAGATIGKAEAARPGLAPSSRKVT